MSSFSDYRKPKRSIGGTCRRCGGSAEGRVVVTLQARKRAEGRTVKDANAWSYPSIDSTSGTYCETCAIDTYEEAKPPVLREGTA